MGNCLVTKLKGTVNNDSLTKLNEIQFIAAKEATYIAIVANAENKVLVTFNGAMSNGNKEVYAPTSGTIRMSSDEGVDVVKIYANPKYDIVEIGDVWPVDGLRILSHNNIISIGCVGSRFNRVLVDKLKEINISIDDLKGFTNKGALTSINFNCSNSFITGNIDSLSDFTNLKTLNIIVSGVTGNIKSLEKLTQLTDIRFNSSDGVTGDIKSLGKMTNLKSIDLFRTSVGGTVESFVQAQRAAGRTVETEGITINKSLGKVTFEGNVVDSSATLTWTSDTITVAKA